MKKIINVKVEETPDPDPDHSYLETEYEYRDDGTINIISSARYSNDEVRKYGTDRVLQWINDDRKRAAGYELDWIMVGIRAVAEITVLGFDQQIMTAGVWGIESDIKDSAKKEIADEELSTLMKMLKRIGFEEDEIRMSFLTADTKW